MFGGYSQELSESKCPDISSVFFSILADSDSTMSWSVSILPQYFYSANLDSHAFGTDPSVLVIIDTTPFKFFFAFSFAGMFLIDCFFLRYIFVLCKYENVLD